MALFERILDWDRSLLLSINGIHAPWLDRFMWLFSETFMWFPVMIALIYVLIKNKNSQAFLLLIAFALLILFTDQMSSAFFKPLVARLRPTHDPHIANMITIVNGYRGGEYGFLSSHAANVFAFAGLSILFFRNWAYSAVLLLWAITVSYSRVYLGVHYPLDVISGAFFGLCSSVAFFYLYKYFLQKSTGLRLRMDRRPRQMTSTSYQKNDLYFLILVLVLNVSVMLLASIYLAW